jgi:hypothetical protein
VLESGAIPSTSDDDVWIDRFAIIHTNVVAEAAIVAYEGIYAAGFCGLVGVIAEIILKRGIRIVRSSANAIVDVRLERQQKNLGAFRKIIIVVALIRPL